MKAIILKEAGGVENLVVEELENPVINANEVLVRTKAVSVNPVDWKVRGNEPFIDMIYGSERPVILGWDVAGVVEQVGDKVTKFEAGDKVFGMVNFPGAGKAYADCVSVPEDHLAAVPEGTSFEEAAGATLAALTALQAMRGKVKAGDKVLIHAGSGGVGHYAIQMAKKMGAHVITTCSAKNKEFVMSMGADEHVDYRTQAFEEVLSGVDYVLDGMGGDTLMKSLKVIKEGGTVVSLPSPQISDEVLEEAKKLKVNAEGIMVQSNGDDMNELKEMMAAGTLKSHISKTFSFAQMGEAHTEVESGRTVGKVVVTI